MTTLII